MLIAAHWDDLLRLAASVRTGAVSASLMLKRLGAYPRQNGLALALREVGRIARTLHTLDWLQMPALMLTVSTLAVLIFSAFILYDLQRVVNGGETNYVTATLSVYLSVYNVFANLLMLLGVFGGERD